MTNYSDLFQLKLVMSVILGSAERVLASTFRTPSAVMIRYALVRAGLSPTVKAQTVNQVSTFMTGVLVSRTQFTLILYYHKHVNQETLKHKALQLNALINQHILKLN